MRRELGRVVLFVSSIYTPRLKLVMCLYLDNSSSVNVFDEVPMWRLCIAEQVLRLISRSASKII